MGSCCDPRGYERKFGERTARRNAEAYRRGRPDATATWIVARLRDRGVEGLSVLEVGGGVGGIQLDLLRAGAARSTNVELSPEYEQAAIDLARDAGVADRVERRVGDFADFAGEIGPADVVVLHRVVCCYPYLERLLGPAADRARRVLALTYPRSTPIVRIGLRIGNLWFRITRCSFRVFVHSPAEISRVVAERGLLVTGRHVGILWESAVFERA